MPHATLNVLWARHMQEGENDRDSSELYTRNYLAYMKEAVKGSSGMGGRGVVVLHGKGGSGMGYKEKLKPLEAYLREGSSLGEFVYPDAPFEKGQWWKLAPGARSFTASKYEGYDSAVAVLRGELEATRPEVLIGHSQGAILIASVLSNCGQEAFTSFGVKTIVMNGGKN